MMYGGNKTMIITKEGCAYKALSNLYDWYNLSMPSYLEALKCDVCSGDRICKTTLEQLIELNEVRKINNAQLQK